MPGQMHDTHMRSSWGQWPWWELAGRLCCHSNPILFLPAQPRSRLSCPQQGWAGKPHGETFLTQKPTLRLLPLLHQLPKLVLLKLHQVPAGAEAPITPHRPLLCHCFISVVALGGCFVVVVVNSHLRIFFSTDF